MRRVGMELHGVSGQGFWSPIFLIAASSCLISGLILVCIHPVSQDGCTSHLLYSTAPFQKGWISLTVTAAVSRASWRVAAPHSGQVIGDGKKALGLH